MPEHWLPVPEFPSYLVSRDGEVFNIRTKRMMRATAQATGHLKIGLLDEDGSRHTRSVALLVACAFVEPPDEYCDHVVLLDGNPSNVRASNLVWRPKWFLQVYARQLKDPQPTRYEDFKVINTETGNMYSSVISAGVSEGLLFRDIWRACETGMEVFPTLCTFAFL